MFKNSISKYLLIKVLLISSSLTIVFTSISFYLDYTEEKKVLLNTKIQIDNQFIPLLSKSMLDYNLDAILIQLKTLENFKEILGVSLIDTTGEIIKEWNRELQKPLGFLETWNYSLHYRDEYISEDLGVLRVTITQEYMYLKIIHKMIYFFFSQGMKTFIVSIILLLIFNKSIVSRIVKISEELEKLRKSEYRQYQKIDDDFPSKDEISDVLQVLNGVGPLLVEKLSVTNKELLEQKVKSMHSARLASLGEMAGGIAHEINNPLAIIDGQIGVLLREDYTPSEEEIKKRLKTIESMIKRISSIVAGLKFFSRDGSRDSFERVNIVNVIDDTLALCQEKLKSKGVKVTFSPYREEILVYAKAVQISQVFLNFLNNAYDAIENSMEPFIRISVDNIDEQIVIKFANNGPKIPEEIREKIMQPFFTTKEIGKGTGLGLSISLGIVENHSGKIIVESDDSLTCFSVVLPAIT